jgi:hypothetical protein
VPYFANEEKPGAAVGFQSRVAPASMAPRAGLIPSLPAILVVVAVRTLL